MSTRTRSARRRGFTLIELLVVIAIIGLLATVVAFSVTGASDEANRGKVQADFSILTDAVDMYRLKHKKYPQKLADLVASDVIRKLQNDPWGNPYLYTPPAGSKRFVIASYGSDGAPGGTESAQDLSTENIDSILAGR